jgi:NAD(P)H dehydrogenase (quinone)
MVIDSSNRAMDKVRLAVIYYSSTGINYQLACWAAEAGLAFGAEVRLRKVHELAPDSAIDRRPAWRAHIEATRGMREASSDDLVWADTFIFSTPTRYGTVSAQLKEFLDTQGSLWAQGKLAGKVVSGMASANNPHGGQEATLLSLYINMIHWGAIIVPPGYTDESVFRAGGNPYGTTATGRDGQMVQDVRDAVHYQARLTLSVAARLKAGKAALAAGDV